MPRMSRTFRASLLTVVLVPITLVVGQTSSGAATTAPARGLGAAVVVGSPQSADGIGSIQIEQTNGQTDQFGPHRLGLSNKKIGFGSAIAVGEVTGDGLSDVVVGAPQGGTDDAGRAFLLVSGSPDVITEGQTTELKAGQTAGDYFGWSAAVSPRSDGSGSDLWVGAPQRAASGKTAAGAVFHFPVSPDGTVGAAEEITQETPGVPGNSEKGDAFGMTLAPLTDGVVVGSPLENVGPAADAGMVTRLHRAADGTLSGQGITQDSPGVPGTAEKGDWFGQSVAGGGTLIGAPGETLHGHAQAGMVNTFSEAADGTLTPGPGFTQDTPGIPGTAETGDRFGQSVSVGVFRCAGVRSMAVGAPHETISGQLYAGLVVVAPMPGAGSCITEQLYQTNGLPGALERYDQTGWSLSSVPGGTALQPGFDQLIIGAPAEKVGNSTDAGSVMLWRPTSRTVTFWAGFGSAAEQFFGEKLSS